MIWTRGKKMWLVWDDSTVQWTFLTREMITYKFNKSTIRFVGFTIDLREVHINSQI
jgi:hypothetical protein